MDAQDVCESIEGMAADQVAISIVDLFQTIEVEEENGEGAAVAIGALGFRFKDVEQAAVVGESGERVADGEVANLLEEARVVEENTAESDRVTGDGECLRENEGRIEQPLGLRGGELRTEIHPSGGVDGAVEGRVFELEAAAIPDYGDEENSGGQELLRAGENRAGMRGNFRGKAAQCCGDEIG